jgi:NAD(P)-dependent dehydrogenase (short-subunit alcohol dehydrogenase family)
MRGVVTGAAGGIGRATAIRLATDAGRNVDAHRGLVLVDRVRDELSETMRMVEAVGCQAVAVVEDLSDPAGVDRIAAAAKDHLGAVDVLASVAGVARSSSLLELSLDDYEWEFAVNTRATWLLVKHLYPLLIVGPGSVIVVASISASNATPGLGAYSPSKAALSMLVRQLANELGPDGIRCNGVSPGQTLTPMTKHIYEDPEASRLRLANIPLRRIAQPDDIAAAVAFLASRDAAYITGVDLLVDGGLHTALMAMARADAKL